MNLLRDHGESALIALVRRVFRQNFPLEIGIGDDGAVFKHEGRVVAVADAMVEDVHFTRAHCPPRAIGRKLVAVNVSDIAAMGARPTAALFTGSLSKTLPWDWVTELVEGVGEEADRWGLTVCGGDVTGSPGPVSLSLSVLGALVGARPLLRSGARPGDGVFVTGTLGGSGYGLSVLNGGGSRVGAEDAITRHLTPTPRLHEGTLLADWGGVGAVMDLSDGLAQDLPRLLAASSVAARIDLERVPVHSDIVREVPTRGLSLALHGGEDYELLFTGRGEPPFAAHRIGEITTGSGVLWLQEGVAADISSEDAFSHF